MVWGIYFISIALGSCRAIPQIDLIKENDNPKRALDLEDAPMRVAGTLGYQSVQEDCPSFRPSSSMPARAGPKQTSESPHIRLDSLSRGCP